MATKKSDLWHYDITDRQRELLVDVLDELCRSWAKKAGDGNVLNTDQIGMRYACSVASDLADVFRV